MGSLRTTLGLRLSVLGLVGVAACGNNASSGTPTSAAPEIAMVSAQTLAPGDACPAGGQVIGVGIDTDANGVLDATEVTSTYTICNGVPGAAGAPGPAALINEVVVPSGSDCALGGTRVEVGTDVNDNGVLDTDEITKATFVCNGGGRTTVGQQQGTSSEPVVVPLSTKQIMTVPASGSSYYSFVAYADSTHTYDGPYTLILGSLESDLTVELFDDVFGGHEVPVDCEYSEASEKHCHTQFLTAGHTYYWQLTDTYDVPNQFEMALAFGSAQGTYDAPMPLGDFSSGTTPTITLRGSRGATCPLIGYCGQDDSSYSFVAPVSGQYSVAIDHLLSLPVDPSGFAASVYILFPVGASASCSSAGVNAGCTLQTGPSQNLTAGQTYTISVTGYNGIGNALAALAGGTFDLTITAPTP